MDTNKREKENTMNINKTMTLTVQYTFNIDDDIEDYILGTLDKEVEHATEHELQEAYSHVIDSLNDKQSVSDFLEYIARYKEPRQVMNDDEWSQDDKSGKVNRHFRYKFEEVF